MTTVVQVFHGGPYDGLRRNCWAWPPRETIKVPSGLYRRSTAVSDHPCALEGVEYQFESAQ